MPLTPDEELELINTELAIRDKQKPTASPVMDAVKQGVQSIPGVGSALSLTEQFTKLPPEAQKAIMSGGGAEAGLAVAGPVGSAAGAMMGGAASEAANNPSELVKTVSPILKTITAPTSESVMDTINQITSPKAKDFMERRAVEGATALASGAALKGMRGVEASGPVSAGVENPSIVFKATRDKVMKELGLAKGEAMSGEALAEGQRLMKYLRTPAGQGRLADEAIKAVEDGTKLSNTQLMAYDEALGKVQTKGGTFSHIYKGARDQIRSQLQEQAPTVMKYKALARKVFLSEGNGESPSLIQAVQHPISSAVHFPGIQRALGSAMRVGAEGIFPAVVGASDMLSSTLQDLAEKRRGVK